MNAWQAQTTALRQERRDRFEHRRYDGHNRTAHAVRLRDLSTRRLRRRWTRRLDEWAATWVEARPGRWR